MEKQGNFRSHPASTIWRSSLTGADQRLLSSPLLKAMPSLFTQSLTFGVQECWRHYGVHSLCGVPGSSSLIVNERNRLVTSAKMGTFLFECAPPRPGLAWVAAFR